MGLSQNSKNLIQVSRIKAIHICKNLINTIEKLPENQRKRWLWEPPQARRKDLTKVLNKLIKKHKIKEKELYK
jgi:hypothetical protein